MPKKDSQILKILKAPFIAAYLLIKNYIFILLCGLVVFTLLNLFLGSPLPLQSGWILGAFVISFCIIAPELIKGNVYFGRRLIFPKDIVFFLTCVISVFIYFLLGALSLISRVFWALAIGLLTLQVLLRALKLHKPKSKKFGGIKILKLLFIFSFVLFILQFMTAIGQKFMSSGSQEYRSFIQEEITDQAQRIWSSLPAQGGSLWDKLTQKPGLIETQSGATNTGSTIGTGTATGTEISSGVVIKISLDEMMGSGNTSNTGNSDTGQILDTIKNTGTVTTTLPKPTTTTVITPKPTTPTATATNLRNKKTAITFYELIPFLVKTYGLGISPKKDIAFTYLKQTDSAYQAFKTAYYRRLIGRDINVKLGVKCDNYIVMLGLIKGWKVDTSAGVIDAYRNYASTNNQLKGCVKGAYLIGKNI